MIAAACVLLGLATYWFFHRVFSLAAVVMIDAAMLAAVWFALAALKKPASVRWVATIGSYAGSGLIWVAFNGGHWTAEGFLGPWILLFLAHCRLFPPCLAD